MLPPDVRLFLSASISSVRLLRPPTFLPALTHQRRRAGRKLDGFIAAADDWQHRFPRDLGACESIPAEAYKTACYSTRPGAAPMLRCRKPGSFSSLPWTFQLHMMIGKDGPNSRHPPSVKTDTSSIDWPRGNPYAEAPCNCRWSFDAV